MGCLFVLGYVNSVLDALMVSCACLIVSLIGFGLALRSLVSCYFLLVDLCLYC